jgi:hypothetical protein
MARRPRRRRWFTAAALATVSVVVGACGGGGSNTAISVTSAPPAPPTTAAPVVTPSTSAAEPCPVDAADVADVLGFEVEDQGDCSFVATSDEHLGANVNLGVTPFQGDETAIATVKSNLGATEDVEGLGEAAFLVDVSILVTLYVFNEGKQYTISAADLSNDRNATVAALEELYRTASAA